MASNVAIQAEALSRAVSSQSLSNYATIIRGFMAKGLSESEILPRENVFTYNAWKALGRQVCKGQHGVRVVTIITTKDKRTGREERRPWSTTVFHISQTEKIGAIACNERLADLDATPENIPYAGEAETDEAELQAHSDAVHAGRETPKESDIVLYPDAATDTPDAWRAAPVNTAELDAFALAAPAPPAPHAPGSAYDRAMRGETVNIMDIIAEQSEANRQRNLNAKYGTRGAARINARSFQSKTVEF